MECECGAEMFSIRPKVWACPNCEKETGDAEYWRQRAEKAEAELLDYKRMLKESHDNARALYDKLCQYRQELLADHLECCGIFDDGICDCSYEEGE